jgi:hypothetical protein
MPSIIPIRENAIACFREVETEAHRRSHTTADVNLQGYYALVAACLSLYPHSDHCTCGATAMPEAA